MNINEYSEGYWVCSEYKLILMSTVNINACIGTSSGYREYKLLHDGYIEYYSVIK